MNRKGKIYIHKTATDLVRADYGENGCRQKMARLKMAKT